MTNKDELPIDRAQEDRTVEYLRANGVFGIRAKATASEPSTAPQRIPNKWRVPIIAAAAAVLITFISAVVDFTNEPAPEVETPATSTPRLLVWY